MDTCLSLQPIDVYDALDWAEFNIIDVGAGVTGIKPNVALLYIASDAFSFSSTSTPIQFIQNLHFYHFRRQKVYNIFFSKLGLYVLPFANEPKIPTQIPPIKLSRGKAIAQVRKPIATIQVLDLVILPSNILHGLEEVDPTPWPHHGLAVNGPAFEPAAAGRRPCCAGQEGAAVLGEIGNGGGRRGEGRNALVGHFAEHEHEMPRQGFSDGKEGAMTVRPERTVEDCEERSFCQLSAHCPHGCIGESSGLLR